MTARSHLLYAYGFRSGQPVKVDGKVVDITGKTPEDILNRINKLREHFSAKGKLKEFDDAMQDAAEHDWQEVTKEQVMLMDYPKPHTKYILITENPNENVESVYHWIIDNLKDLGYPIVDKVTDIFTASEHSSFYGAAGQRLSLAQDKAAGYLANIGKMIKDLFQLVRELRIIDERLLYYKNSQGLGLEREGETLTDKQKQERRTAAEVALKGLWVDLVDGVVGGQRTGSNIFNMAQQLQFTTLPDLFFSIHPEKPEEVTDAVEKGAKEFNKQVRNALMRKLYAYLTWKQSTYVELQNRRKFNVKYLKQHYEVIRMYMNWVKPYLKHAQKLQMSGERGDSHKIISAFESSLVDIELLARMMAKGNKKVWSVALINMEYRTRPQMQMGEPGQYHRGPIHVGETTIHWRCYTWTEEQVQNYLNMRRQEDIELFGAVDESLKSAMDALGDDLRNYLAEAEAGPLEPEEKKKSADLFEPFVATAKGLQDIFKAFKPPLPAKKKKAKEDLSGELKSAKKTGTFFMYLNYKLYKKAHGMITW